MIAQELEVSLHMAFVEARQARHEFITVEHLLLALLDNPSAAEVLRACACNIEDLRKSLAFKDSMHQTDLVDTLIMCEIVGTRPDAVIIGIVDTVEIAGKRVEKP